MGTYTTLSECAAALRTVADYIGNRTDGNDLLWAEYDALYESLIGYDKAD